MLCTTIRFCHHRPLFLGIRMPQKSITSFFEVTQKRKATGVAEERISKRTTVQLTRWCTSTHNAKEECQLLGPCLRELK